MAVFANMFCITNGCKNKTDMKVAATNMKIKIHQMFPKRRIPGVGVTIAYHGKSQRNGHELAFE